MLIAIYATLNIAASLYHFEATGTLFWIGASGLLVAGVSFIDDRISIPVIYRLIAHVVATLLILQAGLGLERIEFPGGAVALPATIAGAASLLYVVWMINLYNFMDGVDGLAAGMAILGFGVYAVIGAMVGDAPFALTNAVVAASAGGFLVFNFPPARIFMGDVGSSLLGLFAAAFSLWGIQGGVFPFWVALLVFSPFIVDATVTLLRRACRREKIWRAHRSHYYQRLAHLGWGHRKTVLWEYALMAACAVSSIWVVRQTESVQWGVIGSWFVTYVLLIVLVGRSERRSGPHN